MAKEKIGSLQQYSFLEQPGIVSERINSINWIKENRRLWQEKPKGDVLLIDWRDGQSFVIDPDSLETKKGNKSKCAAAIILTDSLSRNNAEMVKDKLKWAMFFLQKHESLLFMLESKGGDLEPSWRKKILKGLRVTKTSSKILLWGSQSKKILWEARRPKENEIMNEVGERIKAERRRQYQVGRHRVESNQGAVKIIDVNRRGDELVGLVGEEGGYVVSHQQPKPEDLPSMSPGAKRAYMKMRREEKEKSLPEEKYISGVEAGESCSYKDGPLLWEVAQIDPVKGENRKIRVQTNKYCPHHGLMGREPKIIKVYPRQLRED